MNDSQEISTSTTLLLAFKLIGSPINTKESEMPKDYKPLLFNISQANTSKIVAEISKKTDRIEALLRGGDFAQAKIEINKLDIILKTCKDKLIIFEESFDTNFSKYFKVDTITNGVVNLEENDVISMNALLTMLLKGNCSLDEFITDVKHLKNDLKIDYAEEEEKPKVHYFSLNDFEDKQVYLYRDGYFYSIDKKIIQPLNPDAPMTGAVITSKDVKENIRVVFLKELNKFMEEEDYLQLLEGKAQTPVEVPTIEVPTVEPRVEEEEEETPEIEETPKHTIGESEILRKNRLLQVRSSFENILGYLKSVQMKTKLDIEENNKNLEKAENFVKKAKGAEIRQKYFDTMMKLQKRKNELKAYSKRITAIAKTYKSDYDIFLLEKDMMTTEELTALVKKMAKEEVNIKNTVEGKIEETANEFAM